MPFSVDSFVSPFQQEFHIFHLFVIQIREWKEKYDLVDNDEEDTLTYHYKNTFIFRPDLSENVTGDELIVMPHPCKYENLTKKNVDFLFAK